MLVKVHTIHINDKVINVTKLDIDDYGSDSIRRARAQITSKR